MRAFLACLRVSRSAPINSTSALNIATPRPVGGHTNLAGGLAPACNI